VTDPQGRLTRRFGLPISLLAAAALAVGACGSSAATPPAAVGTVSGGVSATTIPASLALPSASASPGSSADTDAAADANALQQTMVTIIKKVTPAVVVIETSSGLGSGVVYDTSGDIVTNAHVVGTATSFKVTMSGGKVYTGTLVGSYEADDIAVIKISATGLTPAVFGDSSKLSVGDFVLAMGNPLGFQSSVTEGIISALARAVPEPNGTTLPDVIQTSAAINPGNSGGALVDLAGEVVGIPTLGAADPQVGGSAPGIGFAISSNRARLIADQLISTGHVTASGRAYLGVRLEDTAAGATVFSTQAGAPAAKAGIVAGDLILSINGTATADSGAVGAVLAKLQPGDVVQVEVEHSNGTKVTLSVTLGQLPG
jgi:putative serine protease PepD